MREFYNLSGRRGPPPCDTTPHPQYNTTHTRGFTIFVNCLAAAVVQDEILALLPSDTSTIYCIMDYKINYPLVAS